MIFPAIDVSAATATFQVNFFDNNGEAMNLPPAASSDDLIGTPAHGENHTLGIPALRARGIPVSRAIQAGVAGSHPRFSLLFKFSQQRISSMGFLHEGQQAVSA